MSHPNLTPLIRAKATQQLQLRRYRQAGRARSPILLVAFGISSVLVVSVVQKQRDIGILRAVGAGLRRIMTIFWLQGGLVGLVGLVGSILGSALAFGLLVVFSRVFKSTDGSSLFSAQPGSTRC